jgi:hypothetical protein
MDYAGYLVENVGRKDQEFQFAEECRDFLGQCEVVLCCHYWKDRTRETIEAIGRVLADYQRQFVLAVTRLDEWNGEYRSRQRFQQILRELAAGNRSFEILTQHIVGTFKNTGAINVIPLSPLGKDFSGANFPKEKGELSEDDLTSCFGIYAPLKLAVKRRKKKELRVAEELSKLMNERAMLDDALRRAQDSATTLKQQRIQEVRRELDLQKASVAEIASRLPTMTELVWDLHAPRALNIKRHAESQDDGETLTAR